MLIVKLAKSASDMSAIGNGKKEEMTNVCALVGRGETSDAAEEGAGQTISNTRQRTLQRDITWDEIIQPASAS